MEGFDQYPCVQALTNFVNRIKGFGQLRNDPNANAESNLSPYLHFGQLSAQQMALEISKQKGKAKVLLHMQKFVATQS